MRFLKILLIISGSLSCIGLSFFVGLVFWGEGYLEPSIVVLSCLIIAFILSVLNIVYHYKSFYLYKTLQKAYKKFPVLIWMSAAGFNIFLLFLAGLCIEEYLAYHNNGNIYGIKEIAFMLFLLGSGFLGIIELISFKKRVKLRGEKSNLENEINDIGNHTTY